MNATPTYTTVMNTPIALTQLALLNANVLKATLGMDSSATMKMNAVLGLTIVAPMQIVRIPLDLTVANVRLGIQGMASIAQTSTNALREYTLVTKMPLVMTTSVFSLALALTGTLDQGNNAQLLVSLP